MSRSLIFTMLIVVVTTLSNMAIACAPATSPENKPPAPSTPVTTTPAATTTPAISSTTQTADKPIETSFTATTYTSDEYGISIMYPKKWASEPVKPPVILSVREGGQIPNLTITIFNAATFQKEVEVVWAAVPMTNIKYIKQGEKGTLRDGKTETQYDVYKSDYPGGIKLISFSYSIQKGDKVISFSITTIDGLEDEALYKEVFSTVVSK